MPLSFRRSLNAVETYSPPASDNHFCTVFPYLVFTMARNCLVAVIAADFLRRFTVHACDEASS